MKTCSSCRRAKSQRDFYARPGGDGLFAKCKACVLVERRARYAADGDVLRARVREYQAKHSGRVRISAQMSAARSKAADPQKWTERNRASQLKKYGLTPEQADQIFAAQGSACAICRSVHPGRFWTVDHDHVTGTVRGILCWHCNIALGHFRDDVGSLLAAVNYLLDSQEVSDAQQAADPPRSA